MVASQKTMTMAIPLIRALFAGNPTEMGIVTLPILVYHSLETVTAGIMVTPFTKWVEAEEREKSDDERDLAPEIPLVQ